MISLNNPFHQSPVTYYIEMQSKYAFIDALVTALEEFSTNIVYFEKEGSRTVENMPEDLWQIQVYLEKKPDLKLVQEKIEQVSQLQGTIAPTMTLHQVDDQDWVSEVQKNFIPIDAGRFYIHSSTYKEEPPKDKIIIEMNAGRAFGTGEHETTGNCLRAISQLHLDKSGICLDVGCGSGILAIAMAKLWQVPVIATDIDEQAVQVTQENCQLNNVTLVTAELSDGYNAKLLKKHAPYSIITANILASPLISMARDAYKYLAPGGLLILAGFIKDQALDVLHAHTELGLVLEEEILQQDWPVLIMKKPENEALEVPYNCEELSYPSAEIDPHPAKPSNNPWGL